MRKKRVSFFEQVRIREIRVLGNSRSDECSKSDNHNDNHLLDSDGLEYHTELQRDDHGGFSEYHEKLFSEGGRQNGFRGKSERIPSKFLLLPTHKTERWQSTTSPQDQPPASPSSKLNSCSSGSTNLQRSLSRIEEDGDSSYMPSTPRRTSSSEALGRCQYTDTPPLPPRKGDSPCDSLRNKKRTTSAPSLIRRSRLRDRNVANIPLADSGNSTFDCGNSTHTNNNSMNKSPQLPSRSKHKSDRRNRLISLLDPRTSTRSSKKKRSVHDNSRSFDCVRDSINDSCTSNSTSEPFTATPFPVAESRNACFDLRDKTNDSISSNSHNNNHHQSPSSSPSPSKPRSNRRNRLMSLLDIRNCSSSIQKRSVTDSASRNCISEPFTATSFLVPPLTDDIPTATTTTNPEPYNYYSKKEILSSSQRNKELLTQCFPPPESPSRHPESPSRPNLLLRGIGRIDSLRSLTKSDSVRSLTKSPLSRRRGRNDLPPVRPIRCSSVRKLQIDA